jgi:hypothetical protein
MTLFVKDGKRATEVATALVPVADGGTGAADAATARSNLAVIDGVQGQANGGALTPQLAKFNFIAGTNTTISAVQNIDTIDVNIGETASSGKIVQVVYAEVTAPINATGVFPWNNSIPTIGAGTQIIQATITPTSTSNFLLFKFTSHALQANQEATTVALFRSGFTNALAALTTKWLSVGFPNSSGAPAVLRKRLLAPSTGSITYTIRGGSTANASSWNAAAGSVALYGGVCTTSFTITEIKP